MSNECIECLNKYLSNQKNTIRYYGSKKTMLKIESFLYNGQIFDNDSPDAYIVKNNEVLIIEHFEFDSYKKRKGKGSIAREENARFDRALDKMMCDGVTDTVVEKINAKSSYQNYIDNLRGAFNHHYERIDTYIQNLKKCNVINRQTKVEIMFLIENSSPLGCVYLDDDGQIREISLMDCMDFLVHLKGKDKLSYIFYVATTWREKIKEIILCDNLQEYITNAIDYSKVNYIDMETSIVGGTITIPV